MSEKQNLIDHIANRQLPSGASILDGQTVALQAALWRPVISPIDGTQLTEIPDCSTADIHRAVKIARETFERRTWAGMTPKERKARMLRWAALLREEAMDLAVLETRDMGMPIGMAENLDINFAIDSISWYAELADKLYDETITLQDGLLAMMMRTPLGVVGAILPWNAPAMIGAWKMAPALLLGNSVIVKPSEEASLVVLRMAQLALEAGIPTGALQVVTGGAEAGKALGEHRDVDAITFTGSGGTGRALMRAAADSNLKRVSLELGGKSANIVTKDAADLDMAASVAVGFMFSNQGQVCEAPSRLLVQKGIEEEFTARVVAKAKALKVGNPLSLGIDLGPIINGGHHAAILKKIDRAASEGIGFALDGRGVMGIKGGHYLGPTIATSVNPASALAQEEIFGPVLSVMTFETIEEAVQIANATSYGLGASIWSSNIDDVLYLSSRLVAGNINVNGGTGPVVEMPFGGFKQSGFGRDRSLHALDLYSDLKNIVIRSKVR